MVRPAWYDIFLKNLFIFRKIPERKPLLQIGESFVVLRSCCSGISCNTRTFSVRDEIKLRNRIKPTVKGAQSLFCDSSLIRRPTGLTFKDHPRKIVTSDPFVVWSAGYFKKP